MQAKRESGIQSSVVILFMAIGLLPLVAGSLILINGARTTYRQAVGEHLTQLAEYSQVALRDYLTETMRAVSTMTLVGEVRTAVEVSNRRILNPRELLEVEVDWPKLTPENSTVLREVLSNGAADYLKAYRSLSPHISEILVTDRSGRLVAATNKSTDYDQSDERWWKFAFREGTGGSFVGGIAYDQSAATYAFEVAQPIMDEGQTAIGVVKAVVDCTDMFALVNSLQPGEGGGALLIRGDGKVLVSRQATVADDETFAHIDAVRQARLSPRTWIVKGEGEDRVALGLPESQFKQSFPNLDWTVVVQKPMARSPIEGIDNDFLWVIVFTVVLVGASAILYSKVLRRPTIETDPHLDEL